MAAITTKSIVKETDKPKPIKPKGVAVTPDLDKAKAKLTDLGKLLGPKSEAKRLLDEALGLLQ